MSDQLGFTARPVFEIVLLRGAAASAASVDGLGDVDPVDSATPNFRAADVDPVDSATANFPLFTRVKSLARDESDSAFDSPFHAEQIMNIQLLNDHEPLAHPVPGSVSGGRRLP